MPNLGPDDIFDLSLVALPQAFDVVWCKYPYKQHGLAPGPVPRPCLVRRPFIHDTVIRGRTYQVGWLTLIYGTKQIDRFDPPQGLHVNDAGEKKACGLRVDTVFDLSDTATVPWSPIYFLSVRSKQIISGHFTDPMKARLREQYALLTK